MTNREKLNEMSNDELACEFIYFTKSDLPYIGLRGEYFLSVREVIYDNKLWLDEEVEE